MCDEALRLLREVVTGERGKSRVNVDNINVSERSGGSSKDYTLDRLAREEAKANRPPFGCRHLSSQQKAAQQVGTNRQYVSDAKRGASSAPIAWHCFRATGSVCAREVRKWAP